MSAYKGKTYISGPMAELPDNNFEAFFEAEAVLKVQGHKVVSPARLGMSGQHSYQWYMRRNLQMLLQCRTIYLLRWWDQSKSARLERDVAITCGMEIMYERDEDNGVRRN